ncbi:hypothetical protein [Massilia sp. YIM B04103]|uniref:hypothetical protein n=1 Tax=Massilia sp. YIM B04103 TaxID=2963106 RepID=UPI00210E71A3|nr:hypothetical protein [Massilia sp. YIM B04103]
MSAADSGNTVAITNQLNLTLTVYNTTSASPPTDPPSTEQSSYYPVYTKIATIAANATQNVVVPDALARLVICRGDNDFPITVYVPPIMGGGALTVANSDLPACQTAWSFYQTYVSQPYAPLALQFTELLLDDSNLLTLNDQISTFLSQNGYAGCDYFHFSIVAYWATNSLWAWPGSYYCYQPDNNPSEFVLPTVPVGQLVIANGTASYTPTGGAAVPLAFANSVLSSSGATSSSGILLTAVLRNLTWEGKPSENAMCFTGKNAGASFIAQPYADPPIPWWAVAYDMAYTGFLGVQIAMTVDMAVHVLSGIKNGIQYLAGKASDFISSVRSKFEGIGEDADPVASLGDPVEPINVDVDVDVDVDIDTDTDTDEDTDVDVDIDVDIDVDDDVFAIIDVDVDVDVDIDVDNVVDTVDVTDVDTDVDIDTDVNVEPGAITSLLQKVGNWIMTKGLPALVENLAIMAAFQGAQTLLNVWKNAAQKDLQNLSPQQSTGLGLLVNYLLNEKNSVSTRWTTVADYVQQAAPSAVNQQTLLSSVLMTKNADADNAQAAWRWSSSDESDAVRAMGKYTSADQQYQAYQALAAYTYKGQVLPVKVACGVAMKYTALLS